MKRSILHPFIAVVTATLLTSSPAWSELLVYEGFQYYNFEDQLNGQPDGSGSPADTDAVGLGDTWTDQTSISASDMRIVEGSMVFGDLPTEGNHVAPVDRLNNDIMVRPVTADLDSGAELWFSVLAEKVANNFSNGRGGMVIGNKAVDESRVDLASGNDLSGFGFAPTSSGDNWTAYAWTGGVQTAGDASLSVGVGSGEVHMLVGQISFNTGTAGADQYALYDMVLNGGSLDGATLSQIGSTIEIDVDETQLNTLSLTRHVQTAYDEIRMAVSYDELVGSIFGDDDSDGLPNWWELEYFGDTTSANPNEDLPDQDGLTNLEEYELGSNPTLVDTDADGLDDVVETNTGVWVDQNDTGTDPALEDTDADGLIDSVETNTGTYVSTSDTGTDPHNKDSDTDGLFDGVETNTGTLVSPSNTGTNPADPDTDGDGAGDWYEVTASFTDPSNSADKPSVPYPMPNPDPLDEGTTDKPVKVYILSGQSNMVGYGRVSGNQPGTLETLTSENKFPNLVDGSNWSVRNDVIYKGVVSDIGEGPLTADVAGSSYGPELGFGYTMGWYHDEPVLIIKSSIGNRSLGWDCLPPGSTTFEVNDGTTNWTYAGYGDSPDRWETGTTPVPTVWYAGKSYDTFFLDEADMGPDLTWTSGTSYPDNVYIHYNGGSYRATAAHTADASTEPGVGVDWTTVWEVRSDTNVTDVLDNFADLYPDWAAQGFEIAGFVWWQGHKDGGQAGTGTANVYATRYEQNLVNLITQLRTYYENRYPANTVADAPFVVASVGFDAGEWEAGSSADTIFNAQMAVGDDSLHPEFAGTVASFDSTGYWRDFGPSDQGYHYNHNAETYLLVGDAAGREMVSLLSGSVVTESFTEWISGYDLGGDTNFDNDPDGDDIPTGVEAFFGTAPDTFTAGTTVVEGSGNGFSFVHPEASPALSDVTGTYEWSLDLTNWHASGVSTEGVTVSITKNQNTPTTGVTTATVTVDSGTPDKVFARVVATQN